MNLKDFIVVAAVLFLAYKTGETVGARELKRVKGE